MASPNRIRNRDITTVARRRIGIKKIGIKKIGTKKISTRRVGTQKIGDKRMRVLGNKNITSTGIAPFFSTAGTEDCGSPPSPTTQNSTCIGPFNGDLAEIGAAARKQRGCQLHGGWFFPKKDRPIKRGGSHPQTTNRSASMVPRRPYPITKMKAATCSMLRTRRGGGIIATARMPRGLENGKGPSQEASLRMAAET